MNWTIVHGVAVTGHRPNKLGGYDDESPLRRALRVKLAVELQDVGTRQLLRYGPKLVGITGMALGIDQDFARVCVELGVPFVAAVPCDGQDRLWPAASKAHYAQLLAQAVEIVVVSPGPYESWKMQRRNEWMVDRAAEVIAVWNGSDGGTANCVRYAEGLKRPIRRIDPRTVNP